MTNLSDEQLLSLEEMAALFFSIEELAIIMQLDTADFVAAYKIPTSDIYLAVQRGRLRQEALVRKKNFELAQQGSSPAITAAIKLMEATKLDEHIL